MYIVAKRKWRYPLSIEREYAKILVAYVKQKMRIIKTFLPDFETLAQNYSAASADVLLDLIERKTQDAGSMQAHVARIDARVESYNAAEFNSICNSVFGTGLAVITSDRQDADNMQALKEAWVQQNLDLIKSIDSRTIERIRQSLSDAIIQNVLSAELSKYLRDEIPKLAGTTVSRATLIGVDQVGKLNGQMTQYRQQYAGIDRYEWETAHDSRVRPAHRARQGKTYKWDEPPADGNPGMPIRCRCVALPVFDMDKVPIRTKTGTFVFVTGKVIQDNSGNYQLEDTTKKLKATMPPDDYKEYIALVKKDDDIARLYTKADDINTIVRTKNGGSYSPYRNTIDWSYPDPRYIKSGRHKYSTLGHEYGHYFDAKVQYKGLTHAEVDELNSAIGQQWARLDKVASSSDKFLQAIRKDMPGLEEAYLKDGFRAKLASDNSSAGLQDAYDGLFFNHLIRWGHGDKYYNRKFQSISKAGSYKNIKAVLQKRGFNVRKKSDAMAIIRQYEAASEIWANISAGATTQSKELSWFKTYMPNTYKAYTDIIKGAK